MTTTNLITMNVDTILTWVATISTAKAVEIGPDQKYKEKQNNLLTPIEKYAII